MSRIGHLLNARFTPQFTHEKAGRTLNLRPELRYTTHISDEKTPESYWLSWEALAPERPAARHTIERYRLRPAEELYDTSVDPFELQNLAADPGQAARLGRLRGLLEHWRRRQSEDLSKPAMPEDATYGPLRYAG